MLRRCKELQFILNIFIIDITQIICFTLKAGEKSKTINIRNMCKASFFFFNLSKQINIMYFLTLTVMLVVGIHLKLVNIRFNASLCFYYLSETFGKHQIPIHINMHPGWNEIELYLSFNKQNVFLYPYHQFKIYINCKIRRGKMKMKLKQKHMLSTSIFLKYVAFFASLIFSNVFVLRFYCKKKTKKWQFTIVRHLSNLFYRLCLSLITVLY